MILFYDMKETSHKFERKRSIRSYGQKALRNRKTKPHTPNYTVNNKKIYVFVD